MTLLSFTRTNANRLPPACRRPVRASSAVSTVGRIVRHAAAAIGKPIATLVAYRAAVKRLEAGVKGDLFDDPVLWAELKSAAWAEATAL